MHRRNEQAVGKWCWDKDFAFTQDVGRAFVGVYPEIAKRRIDLPYDEALQILSNSVRVPLQNSQMTQYRVRSHGHGCSEYLTVIFGKLSRIGPLLTER